LLAPYRGFGPETAIATEGGKTYMPISFRALKRPWTTMAGEDSLGSNKIAYYLKTSEAWTNKSGSTY